MRVARRVVDWTMHLLVASRAADDTSAPRLEKFHDLILAWAERRHRAALEAYHRAYHRAAWAEERQEAHRASAEKPP